MHAFPQLYALDRVLNIPIRAFEALRMPCSRSNLLPRLWDHRDVTTTHNPLLAAFHAYGFILCLLFTVYFVILDCHGPFLQHGQSECS